MTDPDASNSAKALYAYLQGLTESDQVLFGHQNDVSHSVGNNDLGDVKDVTGSVSGIFGIDSLALFGSEAGGTDAASALQSSIDYSKKAAQNGAIVTLSTHMPNFTNAKIKKNADGTYDFYNCDFNEAKDLSGDSLKKILPGGVDDSHRHPDSDSLRRALALGLHPALDYHPERSRPLHPKPITPWLKTM